MPQPHQHDADRGRRWSRSRLAVAALAVVVLPALLTVVALRAGGPGLQSALEAASPIEEVGRAAADLAERTDDALGGSERREQAPAETADAPTERGLPEPAAGPLEPEPSRPELAETTRQALEELISARANDRGEEAGTPSKASADGAPTFRPEGTRVFVHYTAGAPGGPDRASRVALHLHTQGFEVADIRAVEFPIEDASVRYFFDADRQEAEALGGDLGALLEGDGGQEPTRIEDFTHYRPKPRSGNLEVWIPVS